MGRNCLSHNTVIGYDRIPYDWGYILGTIAGDGSIYYKPSKGGIIELSVKDKDFAGLFASHLNNITKLSLSPKQDNVRPGVWRVRCNHVMLVRDILNLHCWGINEEKTYGWSVPEIVTQNNDMARGFINGFFDSEGNVCKNGYNAMLRMVSVNWSGLNDVKVLLKHIGIQSSLHWEKNTGTWSNGKLGIWHLGIYDQIGVMSYINNIGITMPRKHNELLEIINNHPAPDEKYWTQDELQTLRRLYPVMDINEIIIHLPNRSWQSINHKASRLGISRRNMPIYQYSGI